MIIEKKNDWEYVESKGGSSKLTKAQKKFQNGIEGEGKNYILKRKTIYKDIFEDFNNYL